MKPFSILFFLSVLFCNLQAQSNEIKGIVLNENHQPISFANVALLQASDSVLLMGTTTDAQGNFRLAEKSNAKKLLRVSYLGYTTKFVPAINDKNIEITLLPDAALLEEVTVMGKIRRPMVEMKNGNLIFNVQESASLQGGTALDVLRKTPGLFLDGENNLSINGRAGVLVILNGKQTYMQKSELMSLLRSTPASSIASVEVMNNPTAKFDAEGTAGIVNIVLKKDKRAGFYTSLTNSLVYGERWRDYGDLSLNYNTGKLSLYAGYTQALGSFNYNYGNQRQQSGKFITADSKDHDQRQTITGTLGADYQISDKHTLGAVLSTNILFGPGVIHTDLNVYDDKTRVLENSIYTMSDYYRQKEDYYGSNLHYKFNPDKERTFGFDIDYGHFKAGSGTIQASTYKMPLGNAPKPKTDRSIHSRNIHIFAVSGNAELPLAGGTFSMGAKYSTVKADNVFDLYNVLPTSEVNNPDLSNTFIYREQIAAAYLMYKRTLTEKLSLDGGLRAEYTFSRGVLTPREGSNRLSEENPNDFFNLFPSLGLQYSLGEAHSLSMRYGRRIGRPAYKSLNPFEQPLDELSLWKGNPFLKPQFTDRISMDYAVAKTVIGVSFSLGRNFSAEIIAPMDDKRVAYIPKNLGKQKIIALNAVQQLAPASWWKISLSGNIYHQRNELSLEKLIDMVQEGFAGSISMQNSFTLPFDVLGELSGVYNSRRLGASYETIKSTSSVDFALKRDFWKGKGTVGLALTDIFKGSRWDNYGGFPGFEIDSYGNFDSRQIRLTISLRVGSSKEKKEQHQPNLEEKGRL